MNSVVHTTQPAEIMNRVIMLPSYFVGCLFAVLLIESQGIGAMISGIVIVYSLTCVFTYLVYTYIVGPLLAQINPVALQATNIIAAPKGTTLSHVFQNKSLIPEQNFIPK